METSEIDEETGAYCDAAQIRSFIRAFEQCTLPRSEWTHSAHLTVAMWYLIERSEIEATTLIRNGILRYNGANGIKTQPLAGITKRSPSSGPDSWQSISQQPMPAGRSWNGEWHNSHIRQQGHSVRVLQP